MERPILIMMVGMPCSFKSTVAKAKQKEIDATIISSDAYIEHVAATQGITYQEAFQDNVKEAHRRMLIDVDNAIADHKNVIWDQTNLTRKSRISKLAKFPAVYFKTAYVIGPRSAEVMAEAIAKYRPEKTIPFNVLDSMHRSYQMPMREEGFEQITYADYYYVVEQYTKGNINEN